jgi:cyanuric acid amidohydrolase
MLDKNGVNPKDVVGILAQTEGDAYVRGYAAQCLEILLGERLDLSREEIKARIPMMMIGGTAGIMTPHATFFVKKEVPEGPSAQKRLVIGVKSTRVLLPEEYGTVVQVDEVDQAVQDAIEDAGITEVDDVHCVEVKLPAMTPARVQDAKSRGKEVVSTNPAAASSFAKGASALGVAVALGEVPRGELSDSSINRDWNFYSERASTSAGGEQVACRVIVIGNSTQSASKLVAGHGVMKDQLDLDGAYDAFRGVGLEIRDGRINEKDRNRIKGLFVNAGADFAPSVRDRRHTMHSDFLWSYSGWQAKAVAHAVVSTILGDTLLLASAGAEHQGPPGANLICVIAEA